MRARHAICSGGDSGLRVASDERRRKDARRRRARRIAACSARPAAVADQNKMRSRLKTFFLCLS